MNLQILPKGSIPVQESSLDLISAVEKVFGPLTLDLAATDRDHKAPKWISPEQDTFKVNWAEEIGGGIGWLNPPPGDLEPWAEKCVEESKQGARVLLVAPLEIDGDLFWDYLFSNSVVYVLTPRMSYQGEPTPLIVSAFNVTHEGREPLDFTELYLLNWMTGEVK